MANASSSYPPGLSCSAANVNDVAAGLRQVFESGLTLPLPWRLRQLQSLIRLLEEREADLCSALSSDLGKSPHEVMSSEILYLKNTCKYAKKNLKKWVAPQKVPTPVVAFPTSAAVVAEPLGVVLVIAPWNFPLVLALDPMIGAISAGNTVVLKPSELAPATSEMLAKLIPAYLDPKAVRVVVGGIEECTLLLEQKWDKIFFTGSAEVGKIVMAAATKHLTPVILELGGKCPVLVDSTADLNVTARRLACAKWNCNYGQACIAPDYVLVEASIAPALVAKLRKTLVDFYGEDARLSTDHARLVNQRHLGRMKRLLQEDSVPKTVVHGGVFDEATLYMDPTILLNPSHESSVMKEEIFGPILPIIEVTCMDDAVNFVKARPKPLAVYVFTNNKDFQRKAAVAIQTGSIVFNDSVVQFLLDGLPFGGVGESGTGSYHGKYSFDAFSHPKALVVRGFLVDPSFRYPPFTNTKKRIIQRILEYDYLAAIIALIGLKRGNHKADAYHLQ